MRTIIRDYYAYALENARAEIEATSDEDVLGRDASEWIAYVIRRWGMQQIVIDDAHPELTETENEYVLRGEDFRTGRPAGTRVRETAIDVAIPVEPTDTLTVIWEQGIAPNSYSLSHGYPPFEYDARRGRFVVRTQPDKTAIARAIDEIKEEIQRYNTSIAEGEPGLRRDIERLVNAKRDRVAKKGEVLDALSLAIGIPIGRKADPATVIPIAPKVREKIAPILPPKSKPPTRPVLDAKTFKAILELVDNHCRQFERTPQTYQQLTEEGLRDTILGSLNAVYEGAAVGEAFQGVGKIDIHLGIAQGEVFIAELKFWGGPDTLREVVGQIRGRLTWRDSYGVAIVLSQNAGFSDVLQSILDTLSTIDGFVANSLKRIAENHFEARFSLPGDGARQSTVHVIAYNLYAATPAKRVVRKGPAA